MRLDSYVDLRRQVFIEPGEHAECRRRLVVLTQRSQRVRHGPGGVSDDRGVPGVGLGLAGVDLGDAAHREPGQVADADALVARDRQRQGADRGGLVDDEQQRAVTAELADQSSELGFVLRQGPVQQDPASGVKSDGMVR